MSWLQWTFWDLPYFAVAARPDPAAFRKAIATCGVVYLSIRIFDDVIDRHFWYKGRHPTLLSATSEAQPSGQGAEGLTLLAGLLLCFDGLSTLADPAEAELAGMLRPVLASVRQAVIGAIMERSQPGDWTVPYYDRLVQLKNVDYWRCLYTAIDPERRLPLYPFLERYYTLAQHLNDVQDFAEDERNGQPNLLSLHLPRYDGRRPADRATARRRRSPRPRSSDRSPTSSSTWPGSPPTCRRSIGRSRCSSSASRSTRPTGSVCSDRRRPSRRAPTGPSRARSACTGSRTCTRSSPGPAAARSSRSPARSAAAPSATTCSASRASPTTAARPARTSTSARASRPTCRPAWGGSSTWQEDDDQYLEVQRIYALTICHLLRARSPGSRMLDLGFGRGYLMQLARAYGFEVYGLDSSAAQLDRLWPFFGNRVANLVVGQGGLPWGSFDVVVMSHILEHLPDPAGALSQVRDLLNPGGILYLAVPDMRSLAFQVFGKKWDVVNPLVHLQYFNEDALTRLLRDRGFADLERVRHAPMADEVTPRWLRLMRKLGGTDANELAILAQLPREG